MQVLLGRFFYTATVLVGWAWFGMLGLLIVGYYLNYVAKVPPAGRHGRRRILVVEAVCFLGIAATQVAVNLLHMQPARWKAVADSAWAALADPTFLPRLLHYVLAAVTMAGALVAWGRCAGAASRGRRRHGALRHSRRPRRHPLQLLDGFWLLLALPEEVLQGAHEGRRRDDGAVFPRRAPGARADRGPGADHGPAGAGRGCAPRGRAADGGGRGHGDDAPPAARALPGAARADERMAVQPQWDVFALFLVTFLVCVGLTVWALVRAATDRPAAGEPVA